MKKPRPASIQRLNDRYRNGGDMHESEEQQVRDSLDQMSHARTDHRIVANSLRAMGCQLGDLYAAA